MECVTQKKLRKFGLLVGGIFIAISCPSFYKHHFLVFYAEIISGFILVTFALVLPGYLQMVYSLWVSLGDFLAKINSFIILTIIFFLIFTPLGFLKKIFKKDEQFCSFDPNKESYWIIREERNIKESLPRQF